MCAVDVCSWWAVSGNPQIRNQNYCFSYQILMTHATFLACFFRNLFSIISTKHTKTQNIAPLIFTDGTCNLLYQPNLVYIVFPFNITAHLFCENLFEVLSKSLSHRLKLQRAKISNKAILFPFVQFAVFYNEIDLSLGWKFGTNLIWRCSKILFNFCWNLFLLHLLPLGQNWGADLPPQYPLLTPLISNDLSLSDPSRGPKMIHLTQFPHPTHLNNLLQINAK